MPVDTLTPQNALNHWIDARVDDEAREVLAPADLLTPGLRAMAGSRAGRLGTVTV